MASVFKKKKKHNVFDSGPEAFNLLMKEAVVREFLDEQGGEVGIISSGANVYRGLRRLPFNNNTDWQCSKRLAC